MSPHQDVFVFCGIDGVVCVVDFATFRDGNADRGNQFLGQILVARDGFCDGAGLVGFCRPDTAHRGTVAELDEVAVVEQADLRNLAGFGGIDNGGSGGAKVLAVNLAAQGLDGGLNVIRAVIHGGQQQIAGQFQG